MNSSATLQEKFRLLEGEVGNTLAYEAPCEFQKETFQENASHPELENILNMEKSDDLLCFSFFSTLPIHKRVSSFSRDEANRSAQTPRESLVEKVIRISAFLLVAWFSLFGKFSKKLCNFGCNVIEPATVTLIITAVAVTFGSAFRALNYGKEMERKGDLSKASITLNRSQALMIPVMTSFNLLLMFYLFSSVSQLFTALNAIFSVSSLFFCLSPYVAHMKSQFGLADPFVSRCCSKSFTRLEGLLLVVCIGVVAAWLVSGHWILTNLLGISICIALTSHARLPNIKICAMLLLCLFVYDIFWVFFSEIFFGANVMVSVATQQASNPFHTLANSLSLPGAQVITKKLEMPGKIVIPLNLFSGVLHGENAANFMILGLGDMAIPSMLLAYVLCFDHRKNSNTVNLFELYSSKGHKYIWYALPGYAIGLVTAIAANVLTHSPQPALLYLVPSTLGPVLVVSWIRKELMELWEGSMPNISDKARQIEV
ncbi:signal peptide peptidase-like 1 [Senna tora]|uniref:Signal peptide peptidase-like 1 n=1 Tax=Senna tora TaxID=362788 RepID=A0A834T0S4_9FABA|nr:signal peptide peptidase-like 1 [Senna tora]